ncbi:alpha/beta fold hydrolase [Streptomyces boninensis]|uniref:alpha/beta fold hydrolase n=1 Tax=Streptomyces boninensis TaxID=2039455 RepID=UPI003B21BF43
MLRTRRSSAVLALCATVAAAALVGCSDSPDPDLEALTGKGSDKESGKDSGQGGSDKDSGQPKAATFTGTKKIDVNGQQVNVSCSGTAKGDRPVVVLMHGGGDNLKKFAALQKKLSGTDRVCSYDRLGAGASSKPEKPQTFTSTGRVLTGVIEQIAGDRGVVLAGHSLGGLIAGRYAPEHQDKVRGLVLMDATSPTQIADLHREVPKDATGPGAQLRDQTLAIFRGENPEKLVVKDAKVRPAGDIPVQVIMHGVKYLAKVPQYGPGLEQAWEDGQRKWLALSGRSALGTAQKSEHYIYLDEPDAAVTAILQVTAQAPAKAEPKKHN